MQRPVSFVRGCSDACRVRGEKSQEAIQEMNDKLLNAVYFGNDLQVKSWLYDGADCNARFRDEHNKTALIVATEKGNNEIVSICSKRGRPQYDRWSSE